MNCVSCDMCVYHLVFVCVFFPWGTPQLHSDWSLSYLIIRMICELIM